jgi:hypothetical protein
LEVLEKCCLVLLPAGQYSLVRTGFLSFRSRPGFTSS